MEISSSMQYFTGTNVLRRLLCSGTVGVLGVPVRQDHPGPHLDGTSTKKEVIEWSYFFPIYGVHWEMCPTQLKMLIALEWWLGTGLRQSDAQWDSREWGKDTVTRRGFTPRPFKHSHISKVKPVNLWGIQNGSLSQSDLMTIKQRLGLPWRLIGKLGQQFQG